MAEMHLFGCCCPGCMGLLPESTSDFDTPSPPGEAAATKPVYSKAQIQAALTTADGQYGSVAWGGQTVTYSIGTGALSPGQPFWESEYNGYVAMSAGMEAAAAKAFELFDDLIAIDLVEIENDPSADISFNYSSASNGATYAEYGYSSQSPDGRATFALYDSDLWFAHNWWTHNTASDLYNGGYGVMTYLHEIGHALGLSHPGPYNGSADFGPNATHFQDTRGYTLMSYFNSDENGSGTDHFGTAGRSYAATPLLHDIMVLQEIYGADMTTRTTSTTYGFNSTADRDAFDFTITPNPVVAIWDAGGIDKIDVSGWNTDQVVDLNEGAFSSVGHMSHNLAIAYGAVIELADTGGGHDVLIGNAENNVLNGKGGNDSISGGEGADILFGGAGADDLDGGAGVDWVRFAGSTAGVNADLNAGVGVGGYAQGDNYTGIENASGSDHGDTLTGDHLTANIFYGYDGGDTLFGGGGHDFLLGHDGDDVIYGGTGRDVIRGGAGADHLDGGSEDDWIQYHDAGAGVSLDLGAGSGSGGYAAGDTFVSIENIRGSHYADQITGSAGRNIILAQDGDDTVVGAGGNDVIHGEGGDDLLIGSADAETFYGGAGADEIQGGGGNDWARYNNAAEGVEVSLLTGTGTGGEAAGDVLTGIEWLWGSDYADTLEGDDGANMIRGGDGADTITGHGGNDILQGYGGADTFVFHLDDGVDRINQFDLAEDRIRITSAASFAELSVFTFKGDAAIAYDFGDTILLTGIDEAQVASGLFIFD